MSQLTVRSDAGMGPLEVSVYPPDGDPVEFALSSGLTEKSLPAAAGRYAIVARRPNGSRLSKVVAITNTDETVNLAEQVPGSPNEFMTVENDRGQVVRDPAASERGPWHTNLTGFAGRALTAAVAGAAGVAAGLSVLPTVALGLMAVVPDVQSALNLGLEKLRQDRGHKQLALRIWRLYAPGWTNLGSAGGIANNVAVSGDFIKLTLQPQGTPLAVGLLDQSGFGPIVSVPAFADGVEITFLSKAVLARADDRDGTPGGQRIPVALVTPSNRAAADLLTALAAPSTPLAQALWDQAVPGLMPGDQQNAVEMLMEKFARPSEALLAAHYLLRFLPRSLPLRWAENLVHVMPHAADGPVIAAWARILNRPDGVTDGQIDEAINANITLALQRPVTLFARTRMLLFDALRLTSDSVAAEGHQRQGAFRRFGAEAGGLESFWGGSPSEPGIASAEPNAPYLARIDLSDGAFARPQELGAPARA